MAFIDQKVTEQQIQLSDLTVLNVSSTQHGLVPKATGSTVNFLRADATYAAPPTPSTLELLYVFLFESTGRYNNSVANNGVVTFGTTGLTLDTSATASGSAYANGAFAGGGVGGQQVGNPKFSSCAELGTLGTDFNAYTVIGQMSSLSGGKFVATQVHFGFKITRAASGTISLYATQADATTENASAALATVGAFAPYDLLAQVNGSSSIDYYWRLSNGGALSAATNLTTNFPTNTAGRAGSYLDNNAVASQTTYITNSVSYSRGG